MSPEQDDAVTALRGIWQQSAGEDPTLDMDCGPTKACRNMKDVSFDGFAEEGVDLATAWRSKLAREGKLGGGTVADLVLGEHQ